MNAFAAGVKLLLSSAKAGLGAAEALMGVSGGKSDDIEIALAAYEKGRAAGRADAEARQQALLKGVQIGQSVHEGDELVAALGEQTHAAAQPGAAANPLGDIVGPEVVGDLARSAVGLLALVSKLTALGVTGVTNGVTHVTTAQQRRTP